MFVRRIQHIDELHLDWWNIYFYSLMLLLFWSSSLLFSLLSSPRRPLQILYWFLYDVLECALVVVFFCYYELECE